MTPRGGPLGSCRIRRHGGRRIGGSDEQHARAHRTVVGRRASAARRRGRPAARARARAGAIRQQPGQPPPHGGTASRTGHARSVGKPARHASPVSEAETRVTWRRIVQYLIDAFLVSLIPSLVSIPFDRSSSTFLNIIGGVVSVVLFVLIGLWYWVIRPHCHNGQTFAMKLLGLRVISKRRRPGQPRPALHPLDLPDLRRIPVDVAVHWARSGTIVMLCSRYRQRIGDHLARTLVISTAYGMRRSPQMRLAPVGGQMGMSRSRCRPGRRCSRATMGPEHVPATSGDSAPARRAVTVGRALPAGYRRMPSSPTSADRAPPAPPGGQGGRRSRRLRASGSSGRDRPSLRCLRVQPIASATS